MVASGSPTFSSPSSEMPGTPLHCRPTDALSTTNWYLPTARAIHLCVCLLSCFSHVRLSATLWTVACQAPLSTGFSRQEYWSGLSCPPPGDLPDPGIKPESLCLLHWQAGSFTTSVTWEARHPPLQVLNHAVANIQHPWKEFRVESRNEALCISGKNWHDRSDS